MAVMTVREHCYEFTVCANALAPYDTCYIDVGAIIIAVIRVIEYRGTRNNNTIYCIIIVDNRFTIRPVLGGVWYLACR